MRSATVSTCASCSSEVQTGFWKLHVSDPLLTRVAALRHFSAMLEENLMPLKGMYKAGLMDIDS